MPENPVDHHVTFNISIPGSPTQTLTRTVKARTVEEAIEIAEKDLVIILVRAAWDATIVPKPPTE